MNRSAELTRKVNETLVPKLEKLSGFAGYCLIEADNGVFSSLSLFETLSRARSRRSSSPAGFATKPDDDPQRAQDHERPRSSFTATASWSPRNPTAPQYRRKGPGLPGPFLVALSPGGPALRRPRSPSVAG